MSEEKKSTVINYNRHTYMDARNTFGASTGLLICSDDAGNKQNFQLGPIENDLLFLKLNIEPSMATPIQITPVEYIHNTIEQTKRVWLGKPSGHLYVPGKGAIEEICADLMGKHRFAVQEANAPSVPIAGGTGAQASELKRTPSVPIAK